MQVTTLKEVKANGGRQVVDVGGKKVLVAEAEGQVYAVSNKCTHLNISLVGKTPLLQGKVQGKCIVCPAHGTAFDLATGEVQGPWCPNFPELPFVGKGTKARPLPTFESRVDDCGSIEVAA
ncbi:hypothetical protein WJX81_006893 [Elliptochloris bilobata]|uniref:Rieske domain-containing protein n=1 Tax=Elliptochloris bilobata TaxID=381761 RepID=A0AAW1S0W0_9CHLO